MRRSKLRPLILPGALALYVLIEWVRSRGKVRDPAADVLDALLSRRSYKEAYSFDMSAEIIRSESGTHFDPALAEVFLDMRDELRRISSAPLS